jgi:hypothetical protein
MTIKLPAVILLVIATVTVLISSAGCGGSVDIASAPALLSGSWQVSGRPYDLMMKFNEGGSCSADFNFGRRMPLRDSVVIHNLKSARTWELREDSGKLYLITNDEGGELFQRGQVIHLTSDRLVLRYENAVAGQGVCELTLTSP